MDNSITTPNKSALADVDNIIDRCIVNQDITEAIELGNTLHALKQLVGISLAKLIYKIATNWDLFGIDEDYRTTLAAEWGMSKTVIHRYYDAWSLKEKEIVPDQYQDQFFSLPMKSIIPVASTIKQGYDLEERDWSEIVHSPNESYVRNVLREVKGIELKPGAIRITIDENGSLTAWKEGMGKSIGILFIEKENETIQRAINRIINKTGIQII